MRGAPQGTNKGGGFCLLTANAMILCVSPRYRQKVLLGVSMFFGAFITLGKTHEYKSGSLTSYVSCPTRCYLRSLSLVLGPLYRSSII